MRRLGRLTGTALPSRVAFLDCETRPLVGKQAGNELVHCLRLGVISFARVRRNKLSGLISHTFRSPEELHEILNQNLDARFTLWLFAHSVAYDLQASGMMNWIKEGGLRIATRWKDDDPKAFDDYFAESTPGVFVVNDPPTIMHLETHDGRRMFVLDSLNFFQCSLKKLGERCGLPKLEMPHWDDPDEVWEEYCQRDVDILAKTMWELMRFIKQFGLGTFRYTAASQSMQAFRTKYMTHDIEIHKHVPSRRLERRGYYGGETRLFRIGTFSEPVFQYDVNSLYPFVMYRHEFPTRLIEHRQFSEWIEPPTDVDWSKSIATVWLNQHDREYPCREEERVWYVRGSYPTTLAGPELAWAIESQHVHAVTEWTTYETAPIFEEYVRSLYLLRDEFKMEGDELYADFCKMLLNSLQGKFAQRGSDLIERHAFYEWERWGSRIIIHGKERRRRSFRFMNGRAFEEMPRKDLPNSIPSISAFITAHAREYMSFLREVAGHRNVLYQGVDSLIVTDQGRTKLENAGRIHQRRLGYLKRECEATTLAIKGINHYQIGLKSVLSGRRTDQFRVTATGYRQSVSPHLKTVMFEQPVDGVRRLVRDVTIPREQYHGEVSETGRITPPTIQLPVPELRTAVPGNEGSLLGFIRNDATD